MPTPTAEFTTVLLQATVLLAASAVLVRCLIRLLRPASPAVQRLAWLLVLVQGIVLVRLPVRVPWYEAEPVTAPAAGHALASPMPPRDDVPPPPLEPTIAASEPLAEQPTPYRRDKQRSPTNGSSDGSVRQSERSPTNGTSAGSWWDCAPLVPPYGILLLVWATGMLLAPAYGAWKYLRFLRRIRTVDPGEEAWTAQWLGLLAASGVRPIPLRVTRDAGPALCRLPSGYAVLVPAEVWRGLSPGQREGVLRHELAHYERGDLWRSLLVRLLALPHWFNPAAWWAVRKFDECTEWLCDDAAVVNRPDGHDFAQALVQLGTLGSPHASALSAARGRLFHRIRRLLAANPRKDSIMKKSLLLIAASVLLLFGAFRLQLVAKEPTEAAPVAAEGTLLDKPAVPPARVQLVAKEPAGAPPAAAVAVQPSADQAKAIAEIEKLGGKVTVDGTSPGKPVISVDLWGSRVADAWLVNLEGLTKLQGLRLNGLQASDAGLAHLKGLTQLRTLDAYGPKITDAGLAQLKGLTQFRSLELRGTQVTDAGLVHLEALTKLQTLNVEGRHITDAGLVRLEGLTQLRSLDLRGAQVTDAGLVHLEGLTQLQTLNVGGPTITGAGLVHLKGLSRLQTINLAQTTVNDAGLVYLKGLTQLQSLDLRDTKVTDPGLVHLERLTRLQTLNLKQTNVTSGGMVHLKGLEGLQSLDLSFTKVGDAGLVHLEGLPHLRDLDLAHTEVTNAGLAHLRDLTGLQRLNLDGPLGPLKDTFHMTHTVTFGDPEKGGISRSYSWPAPAPTVSDDGLVYLERLTQLQNLDLGNLEITDIGLAHLEGLTRLQSLDLAGTRVTDRGLVHLKGFNQLQKLNLMLTPVGDAGMVYVGGLTRLRDLNLMNTRIGDTGLACLKGLTDIQTLSLVRAHTSDAGLVYLEGLIKLQKLNLWGTNTTDAGLVHLKGLTQSRWLDLSRTKVTEAGVKSLEQALPKCFIVRPDTPPVFRPLLPWLGQ